MIIILLTLATFCFTLFFANAGFSGVKYETLFLLFYKNIVYKRNIIASNIEIVCWIFEPGGVVIVTIFSSKKRLFILHFSQSSLRAGF